MIVFVFSETWARGKRRGFSPGAAARPLERTRVMRHVARGERMETESKEKEQETKAQQEKEQKNKKEQERKDSGIADASEMREFVQNILTQPVEVAPDAPGISNVCASTGCKQERKKKCTFGMCIGCCKLRPAAGTPQGKCIMGTHHPGHV